MTDRAARLTAIFEKADQKLKAAHRALDARDWDDAASRAYYAAYHAISADLWHRGLVFSSHGQTIGAFNREFVTAGLVPREFARILTRLFEERQLGNYDVIAGVDEGTAREDVAAAERVLDECRRVTTTG